MGVFLQDGRTVPNAGWRAVLLSMLQIAHRRSPLAACC